MFGMHFEEGRIAVLCRLMAYSRPVSCAAGLEMLSARQLQNALEGWVRGMEACKSEQEGQRRQKEEQLYAELEGLKAQLDAHERRASQLTGEAPAAPVISHVVSC